MRRITYLRAINEAIDEEMRRDERVFLMGEDVGKAWGARLGGHPLESSKVYLTSMVQSE